MRKIFTRLLVLVILAIMATAASAQKTSLTAGKVYKFTNCSYSTKVLASNGVDDTRAADYVADDKQQHWLCETEIIDAVTYYKFRNLMNGHYLAGNGKSSNWPMVPGDSVTDIKYFLLETSGSYNVIRSKAHANDGYGYMHSNSSYNIVGWSTDVNGNATSWTIDEVEYEADALEAIIAEIEAIDGEVAAASTYQTYLNNIFEDKACTTFKAGYTFSENEVNYKALPATLQNMVKKVSTGDWSEENANADKHAAGLDWASKYGHKFRVQMYEPFSIAGDITSYLRMNAHANNDNPTGIYVHDRCHIYVMVDGEIKDGASLRLIDAGSNHRIGNATTGGYPLKQGLNIIPYYVAGGHLYVCYNVDTYNPEGATVQDSFPHKLSDYEPLKIHIEGGAINGFYNTCGDFRASAPQAADDMWYQTSGASYDCDADWEYMEVRANLAVLPIISHRQVMLFQLEDTEDDGGTLRPGTKTLLPDNVTVPTVPNYYTDGEPTWADYGMGCDPETGKINIWLETWDRIMHAELATLGLIQKADVDKMNQFYPRWNADGTRGEIYNYGEGHDGKTYQVFCRGLDYSEYYNHHGVALGTISGFMSAGWDAANYNINTLESLVTMAGSCTDGVNNYAVDIWGPAHEIGHQFQGVFNIRGGTEVTNNVFSNAAVFYQGAQTSRYNWGGLDSVLSSFNSETPFINYNIWAMTQMFYKLWLYYHMAGHNTQFYPRFFEMLRIDRLNATSGTATGTESMLKIYEKMCDSAGEDLTEFFRAHGFFVLLDNYAKEDYGTTRFTQTQEEVDAAINRVKSKWSTQNYAVLLINDLATDILCHDGESYRRRFDNTTDSEYGDVTDFINGTASTPVTATGTANSDGTITMSNAEGSAGFIVLDENGELISFSYNSTFALSDEAAYKLATGQATISSVSSTSEITAAEVDVTALQADFLQELMAKAEAIIEKQDETYTKVGWFKPVMVKDLENAYNQAKEVLSTGLGYAAAYELLYNEYVKVRDNADAKIALSTELTYYIQNKAYPTRYLNVSNSVVTALADNSTNAAKWQFVAGTGNAAGRYYIKNLDGQYCPTVTSGSTGGNVLASTTDAGTYTIYEVENGLWAISGTKSHMHSSESQDYTVVGWGSDAPASQWYITAIEDPSAATDIAKDKLRAIIEKTEALTNKLATFSITQGSEVALQCENEGEDYYILCNNPHPSGGDAAGGVAALLDEDNSTYLHSNYNNDTKSTSNDYLQVNLGDGNGLAAFMIAGVQRNVQNDRTISIAIQGSYDKSVWRPVTTVTLDESERAAGAAWSSDGIISLPFPYLRFVITTTHTGAGRYYFHMAKFDLFNASLAATLNDGYSAYSATITNELLCAAYEGTEMGKLWLNYSGATAQELDDYTATLEAKYTALYNAFKAVIDDEKDQLATLIASTNDLIAEVGEATVVAPRVVDLHGKLYAERPYTYGGENHSDYSSQAGDYNLLDEDTSTHFHSDYNFSTMPTNPYIQVDLGEGQTGKGFNFGYTTRNATGCAPKTIKVYGGNPVADPSLDDTQPEYSAEPLATFTSGDGENPLPLTQNTEWSNASPVESATAYRYFKFLVTDSEGTKSSGGVTKYYFVMSEFNFELSAIEEATVKVEYEGLVSTDLLVETRRVVNASDVMVGYAEEYVANVEQIKAQYNALQAAYNALEAAKNNISVAKEELKELIDNTQALYDKMAADGSVNDDYITSELTNEQLAAVAAELASANDVYENATTQAEIGEAKVALQGQYGVLAAVEDTNKKGNLDTTNDLDALIGSVNTLLATISDEAASNLPLRLQTTANEDFYLSVSATGSGAIANLIDKNSDGSANIDSYFGTAWSGVAAYSQYVQVDLGDAVYIQQLLFDYTTRNENRPSDFPSAIKVLGSNDGTNFTEVTSFTENLATTAGTKWAMAEAFEMPVHYRYLRFAAIGTDGTNSFNMSDFNLYVKSDRTVKDYYETAAELDLAGLVQALLSAQYAMERGYITQAQYDAAYEMLDKHYQAATAVVNADKADRSTMSTLITNTTNLINEVAQVAEVVTPVWKDNIGNVYCNADNTSNTSAGENDKRGVSALFDGDVSTHLHTTYGNNTQLDDLDHYIRFDMGTDAAVQKFTFSYTGRESNSNNDPRTMIIQGCDAIDGTWVSIDTLTNLPTSGDKVQYCDTIEADAAYRYIRFMVTDTQNDSYTTYNGIQHKFFVLSEFNFTAMLTALVRDGFYNVTSTMVRDAYNKKDSVQNIIPNTRYLSESDFTTAYNRLEAAYNNLLFYKTHVEKAELCNEMARLSALKEELYEITYNTTEAVSLQNNDPDAAGYLYCNAPGRHNSWGAADQAGVGALLDNDTNTTNYLHTEYTNDAEGNDDGLDHYLRVDVGTATEYIDFKYKGRPSYGGQSPSTIEVWACNDLAADNWVKVKTFENLAQTTGDEVAPGVVGNGIAYRYWRFMVTANHGAGNCNGHPYFALTAFEVNRYTDVEKTLKYGPNIYIYSTDELVTEITSAITTAQSLETSDEATQPQVDEQVAALQAEYDKLAEALLYPNIPVRITADTANPVLYNIYINRGNNNELTKVLAYDDATTMVAVEDFALGEKAQSWYFMTGNDGESDEDILIFPYWNNGAANTTLRLASNTISGGNSKVKAVDGTDAAYIQNWYIKFVEGTTETGWSNLQIQGNTTLYFSNHGGASQKMGFLNDAGDNGSEFQFVLADFSKSEAYYQLYNYYSALSGKVTNFGTAVGVYKEAVANTYNTEYDEATAILESATATDDDYTTAYNELKAANEALVINAPADGAMYRLKCDYENRYLYINDTNEMMWSSTYDTTSSRAIWQFVDNGDGTFKMKSLHTDSYLAAIGNRTTFNDTGVAVTIAPSRQVSGAAEFSTTNPDNGLHAHGGGTTGTTADDYVISHTNTAGANHYYFELVEENAVETTIKHEISLATSTKGDDLTTAYSTLFLSYPVTVPAGVTAYTVTSAPAANVVTLVQLAAAGEIVPANTPMILVGEGNGTMCNMYIKIDGADGDASSEYLGGASYVNYVQCGNDYDLYLLTRVNGVVAMRRAYENYNADGTKHANANSDDGGYVKCPANKAYLKLSTVQAANTTAYYFSFSGLTGIDEMENESNPLAGTIYDLHGRKISEVTVPGLYIIDGKLTNVTPELLK